MISEKKENLESCKEKYLKDKSFREKMEYEGGYFTIFDIQLDEDIL